MIEYDQVGRYSTVCMMLTANKRRSFISFTNVLKPRILLSSLLFSLKVRCLLDAMYLFFSSSLAAKSVALVNHNHNQPELLQNRKPTILDVFSQYNIFTSFKDDSNIVSVGRTRHMMVDLSTTIQTTFLHEFLHKILNSSLEIVFCTVKIFESGYSFDGTSLDFLLEQISLIEEDNERRIDEILIITCFIKELESFDLRIRHEISERRSQGRRQKQGKIS